MAREGDEVEGEVLAFEVGENYDGELALRKQVESAADALLIATVPGFVEATVFIEWAAAEKPEAIDGGLSIESGGGSEHLIENFGRDQFARVES